MDQIPYQKTLNSKFLEEINRENTSRYKHRRDFMTRTLVTQEMMPTIDKFIKNSVRQRDKFNEEKICRQEQIFISCITDKGLISRIQRTENTEHKSNNTTQ